VCGPVSIHGSIGAWLEISAHKDRYLVLLKHVRYVRVFSILVAPRVFVQRQGKDRSIWTIRCKRSAVLHSPKLHLNLLRKTVRNVRTIEGPVFPQAPLCCALNKRYRVTPYLPV